MTVGELKSAARTLPDEAMVNMLVPMEDGEDWRELKAAYPDRELCAGQWRDSLTLVVGDEVE